MLRRFIHANHADWDDCLPAALWAYRVATKTATQHNPFEMVYGTQPLLPAEYVAPTFQSLQPRDYTLHRVLAARLADIHHLEEIRSLAMKNIISKQELTAKYFQASKPPRLFQKGDQVLWCRRDPKIRKSKFESIWYGPYRVQLVLPNNTVLLINNENYDTHATIVNTTKLKQYHALSPNTQPTHSLGEIYKSLEAEAQATAQQLEDTQPPIIELANQDIPEIHISHIQVVPLELPDTDSLGSHGDETPSFPYAILNPSPQPPLSSLGFTQALPYPNCLSPLSPVQFSLLQSTQGRQGNRLLPPPPPYLAPSTPSPLHSFALPARTSQSPCRVCAPPYAFSIVSYPRLPPFPRWLLALHTPRTQDRIQNVDSMARKKPHPPFYVPRMVMEWKRRPDLIWNTKTGLGKYK